MQQTGTYQATSRGFGFFTPEGAVGRDSDCFVPPRKDGGAWHGDQVLVTLRSDPRDKSRKIAQVDQILTRANAIMVGVLARREGRLWLLPSSDRFPLPIAINGSPKGAKAGDRVAVTMASYGGRTTPPTGTVREIFGRDGTRTASVAAILASYEIDPIFPEAVLNEANAIPQTVVDTDLVGRTDLRGQCTVTIDGSSSKDFDDAITLAKEGDSWLLGVHIADVSHYVQSGAPLDLEAWNRGTSVYYADRVVPMLPHVLSNGICSLNPQVDRLALSCTMTLDSQGNRLHYAIEKTVIRSTQRLTYDQCNELLDGRAPTETETAILPMLQDMAELSKVLEHRRRQRGALDLESPECYLICDEAGNPIDIRRRQTGQSEGLIESFMLAANECVAEHLSRGHHPGVYRVHEEPSEDKVRNLKAMLAPLGLDLKSADHHSLQAILTGAKGTVQAPAIHTMVLRSLMKARYDVENLGHFGLAAEYYCHFTSPIRRYPDLMVHRILTALISGEKTGQLSNEAALAAPQSSQRELAAMNAEREIEKCYMAEFMVPQIGNDFTGTVTGVTKFGLFVALENGVEGLVSLMSLPDDQYDYDELRMTLTGHHLGNQYRFGMPLAVTCAAANPGSGQIDFTLTGVASAGIATVQQKKPKSPHKKPQPKPKSTYRAPKRKKATRRR